MANSTTNVDTVIASQASKEVTINAAFDASSQAMTYGRRASTSSGLTWGYYGGNVVKTDGTMAQIANGTLTLSASTTCYIVAAKSTGAVSFSTATTNWLNQTDYWRLYSVVTGTATVTSYTDSRDFVQRPATALSVPADGKTTPVDADYVMLVDTEASSALKRLTWANFKATLKTYFDGLYSAIGHLHTGTYEPADATILKDADIGVSVQAYDADIPTDAASQAEMEAGTESGLRSMSPLRVAQAIAALGGGSGDFKADGSVAMTGDLALADNDITHTESGNTVTLGFVTPTAARAINFQNASGTVSHLDDLTIGNKIINGCCRLQGYGATAAVNNAATYGGCERIAVLPTGFTTATGTIAAAAAATVSGQAQSVTLSTTGSGGVYFLTRLEAKDVRGLNGKTITIGAKVYQDTGGALNASIRVFKANTLDTYSAVTQIGSDFGTVSVASGTPTEISGQITLGATDANTGLAIYVFFAGVGAVTSKTFYIGDFYCVDYPTAIDFGKLIRHYQVEEALCLRYLPRYAPGAINFGLCSCYTPTSTAGSLTIPFDVPARVAPTGISYSDAAHFQVITAAGSFTSSALAISAACSNNFGLVAATISGATGGQSGFCRVLDASAYLRFTGCEL